MVKPNESNVNASEMARSAQSSSNENSGTNISNRPLSSDVWSESEESLLTHDEGLEEVQLPSTSNQTDEFRSDSPSNNGTSMEPSSLEEAECLPGDELKRIFVEQVSQMTNEELLGLNEELARLKKDEFIFSSIVSHFMVEAHRERACCSGTSFNKFIKEFSFLSTRARYLFSITTIKNLDNVVTMSVDKSISPKLYCNQ